jgi:hypothetical protein
LKTGIKTSAPATISPGNALNNTLFFAINQPRVEIVAKTTDKPVSFSVIGKKEYKPGFINTTLEFIYSLEIFKLAEPVYLEINNNIPFGLGLGSHTSFVACLLKAMCDINKINLNNRELYNYLLTTDNTFLHTINPGQLLTSLEGGCMFVDGTTPELYHRIYLPSGLSIMLYNATDQKINKQTSFPNFKSDLNTSIEFVLGLHTNNWEFIKQGFINTHENLSILKLPKDEVDMLLENILGLDYNIRNGVFLLCTNNSLKAEICFDIFLHSIINKGKRKPIMFLSTIDLGGTFKM